MSDSPLTDSLVALQFADRSDPAIELLCTTIETLRAELAREITLNRLIEKELLAFGIELEIDAESKNNPQE
jgi:hypothetical protein